ncbi:HhH-GDP family DNA glycosylase [Nocardia bovistercoris]|uniref:Endonuclease n=1 Tax=Nocardia bovistercoris TaxID=2785916 RepID=A0A931ICZ2_9NOCA|nr:endonuclease [Nocardia bovistercoris]MBH0778871.1 endonuclease [Nocardia bovistercoris]
MTERAVVEELLDTAGRTYAEEAGIALANKPAPLFQLLMMTELLSKPISASLAVGAAKELVGGGYRTPRRVADAERQELVDALGRGHYRRYDESTATNLGELATAVLERYDGDLRELGEEAEHDTARAARLLREFKGIGPTGSDIFLREVQDIWPWSSPYFDDRARRGAARVGLPDDPARLGALAPHRRAALAAALVRVGLDEDLAERIHAAAPE